MIARKIDQLDEDDRRLLAAASVQGNEFESAVLAKALGMDVGEMEERLKRLDRIHAFVRLAGEGDFPDGTPTLRYRFVHVLYQNALYGSLAPSRRASMSRGMAEALLSYYAGQAETVASKLAFLLETARDYMRAADYFWVAAQHASGIFAYNECISLARRGLELLEKLPETPERNQKELQLQLSLGTAFMATHGWGVKDAEDAYSRARALCRQLGDESPRLFPALWGLWLFYWGRGSLHTAAELAQELLTLADRMGDQTLSLQSHHAAWATAFSRGEVQAVIAHTQEGLGLYHADRDAATAATFGNHDPGVCARIFRARALALLGRTEEAISTSHDALVLARELAHPFSQALALVFAAAVAQALRDAEATRAHADAAAAIAREQEFGLMFAWASAFQGWAEAEQGKHEEGLRRIAASISSARATGSDQFLPHLLGLLAEVHLKMGQTGEGLRTVDEALAIVLCTGERFYEPELHRLKGELQLSERDELGGGAEQELLQALGIARRMEAKLLALRTAVTLGRLWLRHGKHGEARNLVVEASLAMGPELVSPDLVEVNAILSRE
jgi:predicted ATPase